MFCLLFCIFELGHGFMALFLCEVPVNSLWPGDTICHMPDGTKPLPEIMLTDHQ